MNKLQIVLWLIERLRDMAARAGEARRRSQEDANEHLGRLESRYDTFKEEAQYLEAAQQHRQAEITGWIHVLEELVHGRPEVLQPAATVRMGALVTVETAAGAEPARFFILPAGAGEELEFDGRTIQTLSVGAPLARSLMGRRPGEAVALGSGVGDRARIVEVE